MDYLAFSHSTTILWLECVVLNLIFLSYFTIHRY